MQQQDQAIVPLGRSNAGKTSCCQNTLEYLVATAGSIDDRVTGKSLCVAGRHGLTERGGGGGSELSILQPDTTRKGEAARVAVIL